MVHLKIIPLKRKLIFNRIMFVCHVELGECMECFETFCAAQKKALGLSHVWRKGSRYRSGFLAGRCGLVGGKVYKKKTEI